MVFSMTKNLLHFDDVELKDHHTLSYYNIQKESTLHLKSRTTIIYVKTETGKRELKVFWSDTIIQIKNMIQNLEGISPDKQCIIFDDVELSDHYTLSFYNIQKESTLYLKSMAIIVYVKMETGETIELELKTNDFIYQVKSMIQNKKH